MSKEIEARKSRSKYCQESLCLIDSPDVCALAAALYILPALNLIVDNDIERPGYRDEGHNTPDNNQENAHGGFSFRVVGEYPEAHHRQVAYSSQGYSMCLKALTS